MNEIPSTIIDQIEDIEDRDINYRTLHVGLNVYNDDKDSRNFKVPYLSILNKYSILFSFKDKRIYMRIIDVERSRYD